MVSLDEKLSKLRKFMSVRGPLTSAPKSGTDRLRLFSDISHAASGTDTNPSEQQKQSGNYRKGRFSMKGMTFVIENPKGSIRSGVSSTGERWSVTMPVHYGYILRTRSEADGDHLDVFIGPDVPGDYVYAIDQSKGDNDFDEHKFMVGFSSKESARKAYTDAFSGVAPFAGMVRLTWQEFKKWVKEGDSSKPMVDQMLRDFSSRVELLKSADAEDGAVYLYGACMVPGVPDLGPFRDYYDADEVKRVARNYMMKSQAIGYRHKAIIPRGDVYLTQSFIAPVELQIGKNLVPAGSWVIEVKITDRRLIEMAKRGEIAAFSIGGDTGQWRFEKRDGTHSKWFGRNAKN